MLACYSYLDNTSYDKLFFQWHKGDVQISMLKWLKSDFWLLFDLIQHGVLSICAT